jgi:hypothetical protein
MAKAEKAEGRKPAFVLRARQSQTPEQVRRREAPFYTQIGAAWPVSWNDKETGEVVNAFSVKLNNLPLQFDGDCIMVPYKEREKVE